MPRWPNIFDSPAPPSGAHWRELFRYDGGRWTPTDGSIPDVAFGGITDNGVPYALAFATTSYRHDNPDRLMMREAMTFVCDRYHCANGRRCKRDGSLE